MKLKIAVVQLEIIQDEIDKNLEKVVSFIKEASSKKANIIVFPEDFLTGIVYYRRDLIDGGKKYLNIFINLAKEFKIDIVTGSIIEKNEKGIYNTTYYIDKTGKVLGKYQKINLWHPERSYINPGNEISVFNTKYGKVGLIICWDLAFPEIFRKMISRGVNIVFCPSYWTLSDGQKGLKLNPNCELEFINNACVTRAFENEIIFVYCNAVGQSKPPYNFWQNMGHSQITAPFYGCLNKLSHFKEEMFIQEVDTEVLKLAESVYKIRNDLKKRVLY